MRFRLDAKDVGSDARAGTIQTGRGSIQTPIFMPVGTLGTVKGVSQKELANEIKSEINLANTYHLSMRPGMDILEKAGGLHKFIGWHRPILTDSGGYQVYSLAKSRKITEDGVTFRSHIDGSKHLFTPENVIDKQRSIGSDIIMPLDECTPPLCSYAYCQESVARTNRWLDRCLKQLERTSSKYGYSQALFPIVQGGVYKDLRQESAHFLVAKNSPGYAIGGVCHTSGHLCEVASGVCEILPKNKPRYMMGVGTPKDILECISLGIDMFDCVMPTRNGRNGFLFTTEGIINIKNRKWKDNFTLLDPNLGGYVSTSYTKAYLHHLIRTGEMLGGRIASLQNLHFYLWLVKQARNHIINGSFATWKHNILKQVMKRL